MEQISDGQNGSVVLPAERFCRSAGRTDGPQSAPYIYRWLKKGMERISDAPYIYRWLKKGMERISDGQNGSAVLPAELMGPKVHRIYIDG